MKELLKVENLCKTYIINKQQNHVLKNVSFSINEGNFISIMGPSGSGKSTLLYTVSGMDRFTAGKVIFNGRNIEDLSANELSELRLNEMGFVFQQMHMMKNLSIYDNIIISAYNSKKGKTKEGRRKINEYAEELMRKLEIIDIAEHDITEVSGGQLQRACIVRALINHPKIIFADEPTGALNSKASGEVISQLNKINSLGTTILLVTHDVKIASKTDNVLYLVDGNIQGEFYLGRFTDETSKKDREKALNNYLMDMGW